jgi:hypothetical protein
MRKVLICIIVLLFAAVSMAAEAPKDESKGTQKAVTITDKDGKALMHFVTVYDKDKKPVQFSVIDADGQEVLRAANANKPKEAPKKGQKK